MKHQESKDAQLVERYLLGEMTEPERSAFEELYFSNPETAADLVSAVKFMENARKPLLALEPEAVRVPSPAPPKPPQNWWDRWLALAPKPALVAACACMAMVLVWQNVRPTGPQPEVTGSYFVTATRVAGNAPLKIAVRPSQRRVALLFNHTDATIAQFQFTLENADGRAVQQFTGEAPQDTNDIQVMIPVDGLSNGVYTLRVRNAASQADVAALPFELVTR